MKRLLIPFFALALCPSTHAMNSVFNTSCYDGDTSTTNAGEKIRLAYIDTPELSKKHVQPEII